MIKKFKKPDLNAPRFREKRLSLLNKKILEEFKAKHPLYENISNEKLKKIIRIYNENLWKAVIENRDGVELPDSLGYLLGKIFYTNASAKYKFKNRELWKFEACRTFKRSVASEYPKDWTKYIVIQNKYQIAHLYQNKIDPDLLKDYNEFDLCVKE
jgi:hypothetical protein